MPNLYIIAGCNGAGKTTASFTVLPEMLHCDEFINADEIARGLSPLNPDKAAIEAGRIMLSKIDRLIITNWTLHLKQHYLQRAIPIRLKEPDKLDIR
jgi:predicted ABC-type ATPase